MRLPSLSAAAAALALTLAAPAFGQYPQQYPPGQYPPQQYPPQQYPPQQYPPQQYPPGQYPPQQYPPYPPQQYPPQYPGQYYPPPPPPPSAPTHATWLEMGYLYGMAAAWGIGTGIWIDAEADVKDPGIRFIAPTIIGVAAPIGVFIADHPPMRAGLPSAIATGLLVGAGEGFGIGSYQFVSADKANEWGFKGIARATFIGSTVGGAGGFVAGYFLKLKPQSNMFITSGAAWGSIVGTLLGGGASKGEWGRANDSVSLGGLIGFNVGVAGAAGLTAAWKPSWSQLGWMWLGLAAGAVISTPVYIFYAAEPAYDPRGGLIFQGVAATLGIAGGAFIGTPDRAGAIVKDDPRGRPVFARLLGGGFFPVRQGIGAQITGELW